MESEVERPTPEVVRAAMGIIEDPEIGLPIVELGLVYDISVSSEGTVEVVYTLTSLGCPVGPLIDRQIHDIASALPGVERVETRIVFQPPWTPDMMSDEAKMALGQF